MEAFSWECPYCNQIATITDANVTNGSFQFDDNNKDGRLCFQTRSITCPNAKCREFVLSAALYKTKHSAQYGAVATGSPILSWRLKPRSKARPFPKYIPKPILDDYEEACAIQDLSPKASATLSRRCLQGVIRDFWKVKGKSLKAEIEKIKTQIDKKTWAAIDAVRSVGNIGAHMEKDINLVIDVEPEEAELLIGLIELLLKDWYIARNDREEHLSAIVAVAEAKKEAKKANSQPAAKAAVEGGGTA